MQNITELKTVKLTDSQWAKYRVFASRYRTDGLMATALGIPRTTAKRILRFGIGGGRYVSIIIEKTKNVKLK